jgi:hypothetical protein
MEAKCLRLMGKKLLVALAMEGKFAGEGLQTLDEDDDMLTSMAKELVEKNGIGESADLIWRRVNAEHQRLFPARTEAVPIEPITVPDLAAVQSGVLSHPLIDAALNAEPVLVFGQALTRTPTRRHAQVAVPEQGLWFQEN